MVIIKEASDDEEGDDAPSLVYGSNSDSSDNEDEDPSPTGRGHRVRLATKNYTPSHNNKTYGESHMETSMDSPPALKSCKTGNSSRGNNRVPVVSPRCGNISRRALNQFVINAYPNQQQAQGVRGGGKHPPVGEEESNKGQFMGAGYRMNRGVINLELGPEGPPPSFTEAQLDEHIVGVVFSQQHSLRKGRELFGEKAGILVWILRT